MTYSNSDDLFADFRPSEVLADDDLFVSTTEIALATHSNTSPTENWKILIVDDEADVHEITQLVLSNQVFLNKSLTLLNAYSAMEAKKLLQIHSDIALIFLDVVMESDDAGLTLVRYIRETLHNPFVRIVLRTGQPGYAPEETIILQYEINDYANKTELSRQKLITLTAASLRAYRDIMTLEFYRQSLEEKVKQRTIALEQKNQALNQLNDRLVTLNQEKNNFLGIVAHDLRNPLSGILGLADEMVNCFDAHPKEELISYNEIIRDESDKMLNLVTNLLDVNAIESGENRLSPQPTDIAPIIEKIVQNYRKPAAAKHINLEIQANGLNYEAFVDKGAVQQIFDNLISNAIKYSPHHKQVTITLLAQATTICCSVQDQGPGISPEEQQKLFKKYTRLSPQPTNGEHSTGLGLFIVKRLVKALNGDIFCKSEVGKGSIFIVELPKQ